MYDHDLERWGATMPTAITRDALWSMRVYLLALFAADIGWDDVTILQEDVRTRTLAGQLYRALGSIGANVAEGYSRTTGRDRARLCAYGLGSARESRDWYFKARFRLGEDLARQRMELLAEIIRHLLKIIRAQPGQVLREPLSRYTPSPRPTDAIARGYTDGFRPRASGRRASAAGAPVNRAPTGNRAR